MSSSSTPSSSHEPLYPLRFAPLFRRYLWGGRRLGTVLGKAIGAGEDYAESWEVVDHGEDQSRVLAGPLAGMGLGELVATRPGELLGRALTTDRFPLLFKFLDAHRDLSVQVHPDDAMGATLDPPDLGKTEAWYVLHADEGSRIYAGLRAGVDRQQLAAAIESGTTEQCLHVIPARAGQCIFIPAGTVHAIGAGLLVAEIQQASDTTFRLFDWNRTGPDGQPRPLHIAQSLAAADYQRGPVAPSAPVPRPNAQPGGRCEQLIACDKFVLDRHTLTAEGSFGGDGGFHLLAVLEGQLQLDGDPSGVPLRAGQTSLLPASLGPVAASPNGETLVLDMYLPLTP